MKKKYYGGKFLRTDRACLKLCQRETSSELLSNFKVPLAFRVNGRQMMMFLFDYSPVPGQVAHSPSSRICIVSLRVLSLDLFAAVLALASPHFKFVFPYFYAKIPMDSSFSLCSKTLLFSFLVECEAIENRRQLTYLRQTFFPN